MGLTVQITAGPDAKSSSIAAAGSVQHVITDKEVSAFGLNDAYLKSPTPWNDLYKTYGWEQVQVVLAVKNAQILGVTSNPEIIKTTTLRNDSSKSGSFSASVNDSVTNTSETNWNETTTVDFSQSVEYSVEFEGLGSVGGSTTWSFSQSFGVGGSKSQSVTVGSDQGVYVDLDPGESVQAQLTVSRGVLKARIFYDAYVIGSTAINYNPTYKGHHFWALPIQAIMAAGGIANNRQITEDIEIGYYSNAEVKLSDSKKVALHAVAAAA